MPEPGKDTAEAAERELARRRREEFLRSLDAPHVEAAELADGGPAEWGEVLPVDGEDLVDVTAGTPVRWVPGRGWLDLSSG